MNLDTPEGRYQYSQAHGTDAYNAAMKAKLAADTICTVNGHAIRPVSTFRFGRLYHVGDTGRAFITLEQAKAFATSNH